MSATQDEWAGILEADEIILWQGRPAKGLAFNWKTAKEFAPGLVLVAFSILWMRSSQGADSELRFMGFLIFWIGLFQLCITPFYKGFVRRACTFYTLTNKRAFIGIDYPFAGRALKSYKIGPDTILHYEQGQFDTIYFATEIIKRHDSSDVRKIGFENLCDGQGVYMLMGKLQQGKAL